MKVSVDNLGRIVIPKKYRDELNISGNSSINMILDKESLIIENMSSEDKIDFLKKYFINSWLKNSNHTIFILNRSQIKEILGRNKTKYRNKTFSKIIYEKINDLNFSYERLANFELFNGDNNIYSCKLIKLYNNLGIIGGLVILDEGDISNKQLKFIFDIVHKLCEV